MSLNVTKTISKELFIPFNLQILSIWWRDVECWATARFVCWLSDFLIDWIYPNLESISDNERCPASPSFIYEIHYRKSVGEMARWERERERERDWERDQSVSGSLQMEQYHQLPPSSSSPSNHHYNTVYSISKSSDCKIGTLETSSLYLTLGQSSRNQNGI